MKRNLWLRSLCVFLTLVLVLGFVPTKIRAADTTVTEASEEKIVIDFVDLARKLPEQPWWNDLIMGSIGSANMGQCEQAQYDGLLQYLQENENWTINETRSQFSNMYQAKELVFNTDPAKDWGMRYYAGYCGVSTHDGMYLELTVSADQAGWYEMSVDAFLEQILSAQTSHRFQGGGGYGTILLNDETVLEETSFQGSDMVSKLSCGFVELKEGVNTICIRNTKDVFGGNGHAIRSLCLNAITFEKAKIVEGPVESLRMDFKAFAQKASTQPWWNDLIDSGYEDIKVMGYADRVAMPEQVTQAYGQLLQYMTEQETWRIDEQRSLIALEDALKRIVIDASDNACGLRFYPAWFKGQNGNTAYSQLTFTLDVPKGAEGEYEFFMDILRESPSDGVPQVQNLNPGGGYGDILVNGKLVAQEFDFASRNDRAYRSVENFGVVELKAGSNTITIDLAKDFNGGGNNLHRTISLNAMEFRAVDAKQEPAAVYDFTKAASLTAKGYDAIDDYDDLAAQDTALWKYESGWAYYSAAEQAGIVEDDEIGFTLQVEEDGWYRAKLNTYAQEEGGKADVRFATARSLVECYVPEKTETETFFAPMYLQAGQYPLTMTVSGGSLQFESLELLSMEQPTLELVTGQVDAKANRSVELPVYGFWNGNILDAMTESAWELAASDRDGVEAEIVPATEDAPAMVRIKALQAGEYTVTVSARIYGVQASTEIAVTAAEPAVLQTMSLSVPGVQQQTARDSIQSFELDMTGTDGSKIYADEAEVSYETDVDGIIEINEENGTFRTLQNGDVTVTVTASAGGVTLTDSITLTVADVGENCLPQDISDFENGLDGWMLHGDGYCVVEDGGSQVLQIKVDPNTPFSQIGGAGLEIHPLDGQLAKLLPGHMYEFTARIKIQGYKRAPDAMGDLVFAYQLYDYSANARLGVNADEVLAQQGVDWQAYPQWTEYKMTVRAPVEGSAPIYAMPRLVIFPGAGPDQSLTGYEATVWLDDLQIREVGFAGVQTQFKEEPSDTVTAVPFYIRPYTTTGSFIDVDAERVSSLVTLDTTNDDVITITEPVSRVQMADGTYTPGASVRLRGLNDTAQLTGSVTIHGITHTYAAPVEVSGMADSLRDLAYTLDGFESSVLKYGEVAQGVLTGRTTQLGSITEEKLRADGAVYFTTSDPAIAKVDQETGDVTCVGEGTATITAYALYQGTSASASCVLTVTDDTDLADIDIVSVANYVGVGNKLSFAVQGRKASGGMADMSKYPVAWSLDEQSQTIAALSGDGTLTGLMPGTVTLTATVGVMRNPVTASVSVQVVENSALAGEDIFFDFTDGHLMNIQSCTLEENGIAINKQLTYNKGKEAVTVRHYGFAFIAPVGEGLAFDFAVAKDGWYTFEATGGLFEGGNISDIYIDDSYVGTIDFCQGISGQPYMARSSGNTIWLQAGTHTYRVVSVTQGIQFLGKLLLHAASDPNEVQISASAELSQLLTGQSAKITVSAQDASGKDYALKAVSEYADFTNYYYLISGNPSVAKVSGDTVTGIKAGTVNITVFCRIGEQTVIETLPIRVFSGKIVEAAVKAEQTTVKPDAEPFALTLEVKDRYGGAVNSGFTTQWSSENEAVATVDQNGLVTLSGKTGSCYIACIVTEKERQMHTGIWITVTSGKTEPTIYTYEERQNARENVTKYSWAWQQKETAVATADFVVNNLDRFYDLMIHEGLPRATATYHASYQEAKLCAYCGVDLTANYGVYPWIVDPINNPWKITCPACKSDFPSNDFGAYYASGLDEQGYFDPERADETLLVNTTFPDKPADWGVDDGFGWYTGKKGSNGAPDVYFYMAYYQHMVYYGYGQTKNDLTKSMKALIEAYVLTGDEKYGSAGAILLDRLADLYPEYDMSLYAGQGYCRNDGYSGKGRFAGSIDEGNEVAPMLARAADAFWPAMTNEDVIAYLREHAHLKDMDPEQITPDYVRKHVDDNILREIYTSCLSSHVAGNFGMPQESMALAAVALNSLPESEEMIDWVFRYGLSQADGGNVLYNLVNLVDRNGFGNEVSYQYNRLWYINLGGVADALDGYTAVEGADLWKNAKFVELFRGYGRTVLGGRLLPQVGEAGAVQSPNFMLSVDKNYYLTAFQKTGDPFIAQMIYAGNGNSVAGLHADIYTKNPEAIRTQIQSIIREHGELDMGKSAQLAGFGLTMLRKGPARYVGKEVNADQYFNNFLYYGLTGSGHGQLEALNLGIFAFGLDLTSSMGYPTAVSSASGERQQFVRNTVSHNTVVVDDEGQLEMPYGGFPMHYDDNGVVQVADVDCSNAYAQTDIYRRTVVTVEAPNGVPYTVDFFRILGGSEHVYSFHAVTNVDPATEGLSLIHQPMGSYAGADVPYGIQIHHETNSEIDFNQGSGYSWLKNVYRDMEPKNTFTVDWPIKDFGHQLSTTDGIHMRLTMLSEQPMTEVALADAVPPQNGVNPDVMKYLMVRKSGGNGQDTLFTSVIEPYQHAMQVTETQLVEVKLTQGTQQVTDRAAAVKLTMADGRVDYVVYATNPDCTYEVDGKFSFAGFVGVASYYGETLVYAYGNEATMVTELIENAQPAITGTVTDFTKGLSLDGYTITVETDEPAQAQDFVGRCIYVSNDGQRNAVYQIENAQVSGNTAVLSIGHETLVRSYLDGTNLDRGYVHNIRENDRCEIPLSVTFDASALFVNTADQVVKAGNKLSLTVGVSGSGATYEAEGMPKGMAITASGQITWTTSKTQIGRYPITVKALREGEVVGEMSFTIYVVSYSGSSYAPESCAHTKTVTYTVDGRIETVCPACGTVTKIKEEDQLVKFDLAGANMTLGNELKLNVMAKTSDLTDGTYTAKITHNGETTEQTFVKYNSTYHCVTVSVCAKQMADTITVEVFDEKGNAVSNVYETSVRDYAMRALANSAQSRKFKTLAVDMLNYGAEAQTYFGYNTTDLANNRLTAEQQALATAKVSCSDDRVKGNNYYGSNLSLEDRILLNLFFKNVTSDMYAEITFTDYRGETKTITVDELVKYSGSIYKVVVDDIVLADSFCPVTVTVYNENGTVHGTASDSVESYAARSESTLNDAIMKFAYSAKNYLA